MGFSPIVRCHCGGGLFENAASSISPRTSPSSIVASSTCGMFATCVVLLTCRTSDVLGARQRDDIVALP